MATIFAEHSNLKETLSTLNYALHDSLEVVFDICAHAIMNACLLVS